MSAKVPAKPSKDVLYVDVDDEITAIIDKVENSAHKVVALVLPKRAASLQSIVNMKLLKRSADDGGKNVVLITSEAALLPLAGAAGLHVAKNLQSVPEVPAGPNGLPAAAAAEIPEAAEEAEQQDLPGKFDYSRPIGALADRHEAENPETIDLDDEDEAAAAAETPAKPAKTPKDKKTKVPNFDRFRMLLGLGVLGLVALIVFIILALFVLPSAAITIQTTSEPVSASFNLNASPGAAVDASGGTIPSKLESMNQTGSQQVTATGQQNNGQKATGTVTLSIPCSDVKSFPEQIPGGTGISSNGLNFITQQTVDLTNPSGGGSCSFNGDANVTAQSPGSKYNLSSGSSFSVDGYPSVSGSNSNDLSGGSDNIITVLSQADVDGAKDKLTSGTTGSSFTKSFEDKLAGEGEYVLVSTLKTGTPQITASPAVGQPASTANVSIKITYTVLTVKKSDLSQIIQTKLAGQIDKTKQKLNGNFLNDANVSVQSQNNLSSALLAINEDTTAVPIINVATVKQQSEGQKTGDIQAAISNWAGVKSVNVKLSPFWVSKVPSKASKITVNLVEVKSGNNSGGNSSSSSGP